MPLTNSNTLNTRIQLKYDTYENWMQSTLEILPGEMCVALVDLAQNEVSGTTLTEGSGSSEHQVAYKPAILIKIGDGVQVEDSETFTIRYKYFRELDYVQTKAGDVYGWAKAATQPTAINLMMAPTGELSIVSIADKIAALEQSITADSNTIYSLTIDSDTGKLGIFSKDSKNVSSQWAQVGEWLNVGPSVAADDSITINNKNISVKISSASDNLLSVNTVTGTEGLYVEAPTISAHGVTANEGEAVVLTGLTASGNTFTPTATTIYTKQQINNLINPSMQFKGVATAADLDAMTLTSANLGDSYKLSTAGIASLNSETLQSAKIGDLAIVTAQGTTPETYDWAIIPSGDENFTDTWRSVKYKDYQHSNENPTSVQNFLTSSISTKALEIDAGEGINLSGDTTGTNAILNIDVDTNIIASKNYVDQKTLDVSKLTQDTTYLTFNCGNASGWTS